MEGAVEDVTITDMLPVVIDLPADATSDDHAEAAGLVYVSDGEPGIHRRRRGRGFSYVLDDGSVLPDGPERQRCQALAIPPAWTDVWLCPDPNGHLQAVGVDDAGRKQYRYHPRWRAIRDAVKFHRMEAFADALPTIREAVDADLRRRNLTREKVLAVVVALLDETLMRVGGDANSGDGSAAIGLTSLDCDHVDVDGARIHFTFPGKSGREQDIELRHPRLARQLLRCEEIPGQQLFSYRDGDGWRHIDSGQVNHYLHRVAHTDLTAKDFRTWGGTVAAAEVLHEFGPVDARDVDERLLAAIDVAAERLGNTREVCRSSYIDPRLAEVYRNGAFAEAWDDDTESVGWLSPAERAVRRLVASDLAPPNDSANDSTT